MSKALDKRKKSARPRAGRKRKPSDIAQPYVMPKTAAELGLTCFECGVPAEWFDYERAQEDHRRGFICGNHPRGVGAQKLLIKEQQLAQPA